MSHRRPRVRGVNAPVQQIALSLRQTMTPAERALWESLRGHRLDGVGFRRQHPFGRFILDFYAPAYRLAIELDGDIHCGHEERDLQRTRMLAARDVRVIRFANESVQTELQAVLVAIRLAIAQT